MVPLEPDGNRTSSFSRSWSAERRFGSRTIASNPVMPTGRMNAYRGSVHCHVGKVVNVKRYELNVATGKAADRFLSPTTAPIWWMNSSPKL